MNFVQKLLLLCNYFIIFFYYYFVLGSGLFSTPNNLICILHQASRMAVRYGTFGICVLRTSHLEPHRTSVPYFSSIFEPYRTRTITKKTYRTSAPYFSAKIEAYNTVLAYRTAILSFNYSQILTDFEITSP